MTHVKTKITDFLLEMAYKDATPEQLADHIKDLLKQRAALEKDPKTTKWDLPFHDNEINGARMSYGRKTKDPFVWHIPEETAEPRLYYKDGDTIEAGKNHYKWAGNGKEGKAVKVSS